MAQQMFIYVDRDSNDVIKVSIINKASLILDVIRELRINGVIGALADQVHQNPSQLKVDWVIEGGVKE